MTSATATTSIATTITVYRGVPYKKDGVHQASGVTREGTPQLTYRGVSYSNGSAGFRSQATPISEPLGRVVELKFRGTRYQRTV